MWNVPIGRMIREVQRAMEGESMDDYKIIRPSDERRRRRRREDEEKNRKRLRKDRDRSGRGPLSGSGSGPLG